jgi:hypothetical protein
LVTLNPTFKIESPLPKTGNEKLILVIGTDAVSAVSVDEHQNLIALLSYHLPADSSWADASNFIKHLVSEDNWSNGNFNLVHIVYAYPNALLAPKAFTNGHTDHNRHMLELVVGDLTDDTVYTDQLPGMDLHSIYAVPKQIEATMTYLFAHKQEQHLYTILQQIKGLGDNLLYCIFNHSSFTAMLLKDNKLTSLQTYQYKTPEDAAFYLLQACQVHAINSEDVLLQLNGMISKESNLYTELSKYFLQIQLGELPGQFSYPANLTEEYPAHYFSHLMAIAACV